MTQSPSVIAPLLDYMDHATYTIAVTGSTVLSGYPVANIFDPRPSLQWHAGVTPGASWIRTQLDQARAATVWGMTYHNVGTIGATLILSGSADGSSWTTLDSLTPSHDRTFLRTIIGNYKYYRLEIGQGSAVAQVGRFMVGTKMTFEYNVDDPFDPYRRIPKRDMSMSQEGQALGQVVKYQKMDIKPKFVFISRTFLSTFRQWWNDHEGEPFFWQHDPGDYPEDVYYMHMDPKWKVDMPEDIGPQLRKVALRMFGVYEDHGEGD